MEDMAGEIRKPRGEIGADNLAQSRCAMRSSALVIALAIGLGVFSLAVWRQPSDPKAPTILSFSIGQTFEEVANASSYPVVMHSNVPTNASLQVGGTYVTEPAVVLVFNDPTHGFRLPATKFAVVTYMDNKVRTIATSPMLEKLPFERAVSILEDLQNQFKAGGWEPWTLDGSLWFDLSLDGKKRLHARLLQPGYSHETTLRVPGKYSMVFRIWCAEGCSSGRRPYLFLIDVGIGTDLYGDFAADSEPMPPRGY